MFLVSVGITNSVVGIKVCAIAAGIKKYKLIIKKKKKNKHDEIVLLRKIKLDTIEVFICKSLIESYISHQEFVSVNNVLREYNEVKEEIKKILELYNMIDISGKRYGRNGIETIVDNDGILWLNEKRIEEGLYLKKLSIIEQHRQISLKQHVNTI